MEYVGFALLFSVVCAGLGWYVALQKGRSIGEGLLLGLLFGPFGVLIAALLPTQDHL